MKEQSQPTVPRTHLIREIHGLAGVTKCAMIDDTAEGQQVAVTDDFSYVRLALSTSSYPARLTPEQARYIAACLNESADRVERAHAE